MKQIGYAFLVFCWAAGFSAKAQRINIDGLPLYQKENVRNKDGDWLIKPVKQHAAVYRTADQHLAFSNGLITRTFAINPNGATIGLDNLQTNESLLRAVGPEAILWISGQEIKVGGLTGQPIGNYLLSKWVSQLKADPLSMKLVSYSTNPIRERFEWNRNTSWTPKHLPWPPAGVELTFTYKADNALIQNFINSKSTPLDYLSKLEVKVHYELYDGLPLMSKWITVQNNSSKEVVINNVESEHLAAVEAESEPSSAAWKLPPIFTETDYAFADMTANASRHVVRWQPDPSYTTQVDYGLKNPNLLVCKPQAGINQELAPGKSFEGIRLWELLYDNSDRERRGLAQRKLYRTIAPWVTENPMIMHVSSAADKAVKEAVDQCANVGFEMVIMTFGSGAKLEDTSAANLSRMKQLQDYARTKNIALGGYSLLASRSIDSKNDVVMPGPDVKPTFGNSPCLQSEWGQQYFKKLYTYYGNTGQKVLENDGSYPGDVCASTTHPGHKGLDDSQWKQFVEIRDFYRWCRGKGIYLNVPDWYFLNGSSKTGMGYRETDWSLPREYQEIIERQNVYDGTWEKTPSMGWMFVPLVQYHGGGAAATIEPLKDHLPHYEQRLANLFGAGVQACYRGPRLYDSPETHALVKKWVDFYKKHRAILDADIIHIRRPDGRDFDAILHVDPAGNEKGLLMVYNPLDEPISREIDVDLYYTGLKNKAVMSENGGASRVLTLDGTKAKLKITIPAKSQNYILLTAYEKKK